MDIPHDALAPVSVVFCSINWRRAEGYRNGDQWRSVGHVAPEGLYITFYLLHSWTDKLIVWLMLMQVGWHWRSKVHLRQRFTVWTTRMAHALWATCQLFPGSTASSSSLPTSTSWDHRSLPTSLPYVIFSLLLAFFFLVTISSTYGNFLQTF